MYAYTAASKPQAACLATIAPCWLPVNLVDRDLGRFQASPARLGGHTRRALLPVKDEIDRPGGEWVQVVGVATAADHMHRPQRDQVAPTCTGCSWSVGRPASIRRGTLYCCRQRLCRRDWGTRNQALPDRQCRK